MATQATIKIRMPAASYYTLVHGLGGIVCEQMQDTMTMEKGGAVRNVELDGAASRCIVDLMPNVLGVMAARGAEEKELRNLRSIGRCLAGAITQGVV